jgi:hypothetical protein
MKRAPFTVLLATLLAPMLLAGCLEPNQHPNWVHGQYAGKKDDRAFDTHFHHDRLAWWGAIANRTMNQNEYNRASP